MSWRGGIIGLPNAGKTTIFNALTCGAAEVAPYPFCTISPNTGVAPVPDPRLARLGQLLKPEKLTPASIEFVDVAGLIQGASKGEGLGNQFLGHIREVDLLVHVVRCFADESCPHPLAVLDPVRDVEVVETELLAFSPEERQEFLAGLGLTETGMARLVRESSRLLGLVTFYTIVGPEVRAWHVPAGTPAPRAAGQVHSDMEKGFIRTEVMPFAALDELGSPARVKEAGLLRG